MNTLFYAHGLLDELRLEERAEKPDKEFLTHLDELIRATFDSLADRGRSRRDITMDPSELLEREIGQALKDSWRKRAEETVELIVKYQSMGRGQERDRVRAMLKERHIPV